MNWPRRWARILPHEMIDQNGLTVINEPNEVWVFGILKKQLFDLKVKILETRNFRGDWGFRMSKQDGNKVLEAYPAPDYWENSQPIWEGSA